MSKTEPFDAHTPRRRLPSFRESHQEMKASSYFCCSTGSWRVSINLARVISPKALVEKRKKLKQALHSLDPGALRWSTSWLSGFLIKGFTSFPKILRHNLQEESSRDGLPPPGMASTKCYYRKKFFSVGKLTEKSLGKQMREFADLNSLVSCFEIHESHLLLRIKASGY